MSAAEHLRAVIESFQQLLEGHFKLFKVEVAEDARVIGVQVGKLAAFVPLILVGYAMLCVAFAVFLTRWLPADAAFLIVGVANVGGGAIGIAVVTRSLREKVVLQGTMTELQASSSAIAHAVRAREVERG